MRWYKGNTHTHTINAMATAHLTKSSGGTGRTDTSSAEGGPATEAETSVS
jgi:hypothetical protein